MEERSLAHIEIINSINPIPDADKIEVATVLGWHIVVKKGEFKVGDKIIYVEVDSQLPQEEQYDFMAKYGYRVKTIKLKKQISQGLILPLSSLPDKSVKYEDLVCGLDVTNLLKIRKYYSKSEMRELLLEDEAIQRDKKKAKSFLMRYSWIRNMFLPRNKIVGFPYWVSKTDEQRIQNIPQVLEDFKDDVVYVTEKVDYQSATFTGKVFANPTPLIGKFLPKKFLFVVCSRNLVNNNRTSLYWLIAKKFNIEKILRENPTLTIQGEQGSTNVQGNKYGIKEPDFWVFNIYDHEKKRQYNYMEMLNFCMKYNLKTVPYIGLFKLSELGKTVDELVEYSKGKSIINPKVEREGVVVRCIKDGQKVLSFKVINPNFLLKHDE